MPTNYRVPEIPGDAKLIVSEKAGREKWLEARKGGIGGSEIGALLGVSEYSTPFDVFRAKVGEAKDLSHLPWIQAGHDYEEPVAQRTAREIGLVSRTGGGLWQHPEFDWALVTPDRFVTKNRSWKALGLIECKTAGDHDGWQSGIVHPDGSGDGTAPMTYLAQTQWQMGILGFDIGWLGCQVFDAARSFYVVEVRFDKEWFEEMLNVAETFWHRNVLAWEPPMHDLESPRTTELLKELYPKTISPATEFGEDELEWIIEHEEAKKEADKALARLERAKNGVRLAVGDAGKAYYGDHPVVSYPEVKNGGVDVSMLKEKYPEIAEECAATGTHRRLNIKIPKALRKELGME